MHFVPYWDPSAEPQGSVPLGRCNSTEKCGRKLRNSLVPHVRNGHGLSWDSSCAHSSKQYELLASIAFGKMNISFPPPSAQGCVGRSYRETEVHIPAYQQSNIDRKTVAWLNKIGRYCQVSTEETFSISSQLRYGQARSTGNTEGSESRLESDRISYKRLALKSRPIEYRQGFFLGMCSGYEYLKVPGVMSGGKRKIRRR